MANLAFKKLPLEFEKWKKPELATNEIIRGYDEHNGFTSSLNPCTFTIDLEQVTFIEQIAFLVWDGVWNGENLKLANRRYSFTISTSTDNINYQEIFRENEGIGWYILNFRFGSLTRYVRLTGLKNTANVDFHLVEFQVNDTKKIYDAPIKEVIELIDEKTDVRAIVDLINNGGAEKYQEKLKSTLGELIKTQESIEIQKVEINNLLQSATYLDRAKTFQEIANYNKTEAESWFEKGKYLLLAIFVLSTLLYFCDTRTITAISDASNKGISSF